MKSMTRRLDRWLISIRKDAKYVTEIVIRNNEVIKTKYATERSKNNYTTRGPELSSSMLEDLKAEGFKQRARGELIILARQEAIP